ncbi:hypothetical protein ADICYQ_0826 [Cyclobacterium qasimii M12-11B]|uniref:Uncharacterized protein n=1 Tax=Cyclobacterium qasimii M12-11B TaxID=641524 RepID=S7VKX9_9BACT|nr:hypothetical protein ADICYQ_0826 [Cyclobacterium qasimii M12-11B]
MILAVLLLVFCNNTDKISKQVSNLTLDFSFSSNPGVIKTGIGSIEVSYQTLILANVFEFR